MQFEFRISYQQVDCGRCGAARAIASACPDCGKTPRGGEVDANVVRRSQAIARAEAVRDDLCLINVATPRQLDPAEIRSLCNSLMKALQAVLKDPRDERHQRHLGSSLADIASARESTLLLPARRPGISNRSATLHAIETLEMIWTHYRRAVMTVDPILARQSGMQAQALLDRALEEHVRLAENSSALAAYGSTSSPLFERMLNVLSHSMPGQGALDIARKSSQSASVKLGVPIDLAHGLQYSLLRIVGATVFDEELFHQKLACAIDLCRQSTLLSSIAVQERAVDSLARGVSALFIALQEFELLMPLARDEADVARRVMRLYTDVFEEVGLPLFAWYLLLTGRKSAPFEKLIKEDASTLEGRAAELFPDIFTPMKSFLRNATQHGHSYTFNAGFFHFTLRSYAESVSADEVVDQLYAFLESMSAASFVLTSTLAVTGTTIGLSASDLERLGATPKVFAEIWLADKGLQPAISETADKGWMVQLKAGSECFEVAAVLACDESTPSSISVLSDSSTPSLEVPRQALLDAFQGGDGKSDMDPLSINRLRRESTTEGQPLTSRAEVMFLVAVHASKFLAGDVASGRIIRESARLAAGLSFEQDVQTFVSEIYRGSRGEKAAHERAQRSIREALVGGVPDLRIRSRHVIVA